MQMGVRPPHLVLQSDVRIKPQDGLHDVQWLPLALMLLLCAQHSKVQGGASCLEATGEESAKSGGTHAPEMRVDEEQQEDAAGSIHRAPNSFPPLMPPCHSLR